LCTIYFVDISTLVGGMPPPPLNVGDKEMVEPQEGEAHPNGGVGIWGCSIGL